MTTGRIIHTATPGTIRITLEDGIIQAVESIRADGTVGPLTQDVEVWDFDDDMYDNDHPSMRRNEDGESFFLTVWEVEE